MTPRYGVTAGLKPNGPSLRDKIEAIIYSAIPKYNFMQFNRREKKNNHLINNVHEGLHSGYLKPPHAVEQ